MKQIRKSFRSAKQAEKYQNALYKHYKHVKLITWPLIGEKGTYRWEYGDPVKPAAVTPFTALVREFIKQQQAKP